jgi:hypothetical protein
MSKIRNFEDKGKSKGRPITRHGGHREGSSGISLLIFNVSAGKGWAVNAMPRPV